MRSVDWYRRVVRLELFLICVHLSAAFKAFRNNPLDHRKVSSSLDSA